MRFPNPGGNELAEMGWKSREYGTLYSLNDERLIGFGNPPMDCEWQAKHPGGGCVLLLQVPVNVTKAGVISEEA